MVWNQCLANLHKVRSPLQNNYKSAMEIFLNLKKLLQICGYFQDEINSSEYIIRRIVCIAIILYGLITSVWIILLTNESILEKAKCLQTSVSFVFTLMIHFIFCYWPEQVFTIIGIIESKIGERECHHFNKELSNRRSTRRFFGYYDLCRCENHKHCRVQGSELRSGSFGQQNYI